MVKAPSPEDVMLRWEKLLKQRVEWLQKNGYTHEANLGSWETPDYHIISYRLVGGGILETNADVMGGAYAERRAISLTDLYFRHHSVKEVVRASYNLRTAKTERKRELEAIERRKLVYGL